MSIKLEHVVLASPEQMEFIIEGMRNPMNSWEKSDSKYNDLDEYKLGYADKDLMRRLVMAGTDHRKFMRMMPVYVRITAPLYWWKEFDTYKVGTVANSCSTMHKITEKEFEWGDFSTEHLIRVRDSHLGDTVPTLVFDSVIRGLNFWRSRYLKTKSKDDWWQLIQWNDAQIIKDQDEEICLLRNDFMVGSLSEEILNMTVTGIENDENIENTVVVYVTDKED